MVYSNVTFYYNTLARHQPSYYRQKKHKTKQKRFTFAKLSKLYSLFSQVYPRCRQSILVTTVGYSASLQ